MQNDQGEKETKRLGRNPQGRNGLGTKRLVTGHERLTVYSCNKLCNPKSTYSPLKIIVETNQQ